MIKLIVFLGNPGKEYATTRHNVGFMLADYLFPIISWQNKFHSFYAQNNNTKLLKPLTYMNLSGTAVSEAASFFKLKSDEIIIVHDDTELPLGEARIESGSGLKGHNGLKSIRERLGKGELRRIRIGIGRPKYGDLALFVTSPFSQDELIILTSLFDKIGSHMSALDRDAVIKI